MSNSTTNTLVSSNLTPKQQQQQQQSVYATIKSTNMLSLSNDEQFKNHGHVGEAMQLFDQLLHNKTFLLTFIQVCEENSTFTLKDRCHLASLLTICLRDNLPYFYSIVKCLLADYIAQSFSPTHCNNKNMNRSKLLFRSNESLIEPLLTNWISMFMFDFQKDTQCATHLYRLVKVIKFYLDMGPCDEQTQQATNTLNEERLLKEFIQFQPVYVNIVNKLTAATISNTTTVQICRLLDCDTINQAKEKILDHLFKTNRILFNMFIVS
jgi:plexin B